MKNRKYLRLVNTLNAGTALLMTLLILLMINYLSFRHYYRSDISQTKRYALSSKTAGLLKNLEKTVEVVVFFEPGNVLYEDIHNLLREYQFHTERLNIQWINPNRDFAQTEEMSSKYEVKDPNVVVFACEGRNKYVRADEIAAIDRSSGIERISAFQGEQAFSSAILGVSQDTVPVVYYLTGHGERDITSFDKRHGFSGAAQLIERDNIVLKPLLLISEKKIPNDCAALIIAGASKRMAQAEADLISNWLRYGGRLLILSDAGQVSGLEELLQSWGVVIRNDVVIDPERTLTGREVFVSAYNNHPITKKLDSTAAIFHLPRSVEPDYAQQKKNSADRPQVTALALSSKNGWAETQLEQTPPKYTKDTDDLPGPVAMAVAVEKGGATEQLNMQIRPSRMVVFGDSGFVSNSGLTGGDISLFMSALNWLIDREHLMAIEPKPVDDTRLKLPHEKVRVLFLSTVGAIPALAALLGTLLWFQRRK